MPSHTSPHQPTSPTFTGPAALFLNDIDAVENGNAVFGSIHDASTMPGAFGSQFFSDVSFWPPLPANNVS